MMKEIVGCVKKKQGSFAKRLFIQSKELVGREFRYFGAE